MSSRDGVRTLPRRIHELATSHPERVAITSVAADGAERTIAWAALDRRSTQVARLVAERGIGPDDVVAVALPSGIDHFLATIATWKLGATVLPLGPALPPAYSDPILATARAALVVADGSGWPVAHVSPAEWAAGAERDAGEPLPDRAGRKAGTSGGSTGRPKVVVDPEPWAFVPGELARVMGPAVGLRPGQTQLVAAPLHHGVPFHRAHYGLFEGHTLVLMERFDAGRWVDLVERHRVQMTFVVPTMMSRILRETDVRARDISSLEALAHSAAPTAEWLKRAWIDLLGAEHVYETYGASEMAAMTAIRGDEWLAHPGSVGRPVDGEARILDERRRAVGPGEVGEVFLRDRRRPGAPFVYLGGPPPETTADGFVSSGDLGWLDPDGYLHLADRRADLIISGGMNVYAAEVEAALSSHPRVADVAVIGVPDEDWGKRVHAVVQPADPAAPPTAAELDAHCRALLPVHKCPKTYEMVSALPRNEAGKLQRSGLAAERAARP